MTMNINDHGQHHHLDPQITPKENPKYKRYRRTVSWNQKRWNLGCMHIYVCSPFLFQNNCLAPYTYICVGEHFVYGMKKTFSLKLGKNVGGFFIRIGKKYGRQGSPPLSQHLHKSHLSSQLHITGQPLIYWTWQKFYLVQLCTQSVYGLGASPSSWSIFY